MLVPLRFDEMTQCRPIILLTGTGMLGKDDMTIPDYVAIGILLMMPLAVVRWFAQRKFEL
jgi:hypothetical protein